MRIWSGDLFNEAFYHYDMKERLGVNLLSDNNSEKWGIGCYSVDWKHCY